MPARITSAEVRGWLDDEIQAGRLRRKLTSGQAAQVAAVLLTAGALPVPTRNQRTPAGRKGAAGALQEEKRAQDTLRSARA